MTKKMAAALFILGAIMFTPVLRTNAQTATPNFLITWKAAGSYIPSSYAGKALPTYGSKITASLELISGDNIVNLNSQTIYWYLNGTLLGGGVGVQAISFPPFGEPPTALALRVELPNYNGKFLLHTVQVPMVSPLAVIDAPYPNQQFSGNPLVMTAIPYFFNTVTTSSLSFDWSVNGQAASGTESSPDVNILLPANAPAGTVTLPEVTIKNSLDSTAATASANLIYEPQL